MPDLPRPIAARLQRPSWRDARLVLGVVLVLLAVTLGAVVVAAADDTIPVYAATSGLVPGQALTQQDVRRVDVQLGADRTAYVAADHDIGPDTFALREVRAGELLPTSALGTRSDVRVKPVTVPVDVSSVRALVTGSIVDVWVNERDAGSTTARYGRPQRRLEAATVARVPEVSTGLGSVNGTTGVQVMVPDDVVQDLLAAIDQGARLTLVPVPGSPRQGS
jgi:hypothetical protein